MPCHDQSRRQTEEALLAEECGFSGAFLAVQYLRTHIETHPLNTTPETIEALLSLIRSPRFDRKKQVFFLMGEAADALITLALSREQDVCKAIIAALQEILAGSSGPRVRAVGNAVGRLPVTLSAKTVFLPDPPSSPMPVSLDALLQSFGSPQAAPPAWQGRSLVIPLENRRIGVVKFASSGPNVQELVREHFWQGSMDRFHTVDSETWQIPTPHTLDTHMLFRVTDMEAPNGPPGSFRGVCIAYTADPRYFEYPNEKVSPGAWDRIGSAFFTTARTLGCLTASGLFHTALIPLFHNRVQQERRRDMGRYLWEHGGRLDQWLDSCRFPNFSLSGLRDFEHLEPADSSKELRHYIGEHILSFILVIGSCFRSQAPERRGRDSSGRPSDTRELFHPGRFCHLICGVCQNYFSAFSPTPLPQVFEERIPPLVADLIPAMGIDRDMEETLRVHDQNNMDDAAYRSFLQHRGITSPPPRGQGDIVMETGPHLGGFNQPISVPGLVDFLYNFSSLCVSHCFAKENGLNPRTN